MGEDVAFLWGVWMVDGMSVCRKCSEVRRIRTGYVHFEGGFVEGVCEDHCSGLLMCKQTGGCHIHYNTYGIFLLVHDVVVHLLAEDGAVVEEPDLLHVADVVTFSDHVFRFCDAVQEGETASYLVVDFFKNRFFWYFPPVLHPVIA